MTGVPLSVATVVEEKLCRAGLRCVLTQSDQITVTDELTAGAPGIESLRRSRPDVVLVGLLTSRPKTQDFFHALGESLPDLPVLLVAWSSATPSNHDVRSKADGIITTGASAAELILALRTVAEGTAYYSFSRGQASEQSADSTEPLLTPREREILQLTADGNTSKEIGAILCISHRTVENHISTLRKKLEADNKAALVTQAFKVGLLRV